MLESTKATIPPTGASPTAETSDGRQARLRDALSAARETRDLRVTSGALRDVADMFARHFPGRRAILIADPQSYAVAGKVVLGSLCARDLALPEPLLLADPNLHAEYTFVEKIEAALRGCDAIPIAVGSGTINDLVKLAAHRVDRRYFCVATAASMDGYTAFGASITFRGSKQTFDCPAPMAVLADIDVIRRAPPEMTASGYADLLAKITAGADWILADALSVELIDARAWSIVQGGLRDALADPAGARAGNVMAISQLTEGLMLGGFAMQWTKSSRPASGAEHQFSHLWDMEHHTHQGAAPSHGFKVGIATLAVAALYEAILRQPIATLDVERCCAAWPGRPEAEARVRRLFVREDFLDRAVEETRAKHVSTDELRAQLTRLKNVWPDLSARVRGQLLPLAELRRRLDLVGAPIEPEAIGITRERLRASFVRAYHIRRRFTVLDLAVRTGLLEPALDAIFGPGGIWATSAGAVFNKNHRAP
jgi:glycerol-1-phosphate dehydrogenase [NAD(P)+]